MIQGLSAKKKWALKFNRFSSTFCVYPWIEFLIGPTREARLCCVAGEVLSSKSCTHYSMDDFSLSEIWNSEGMKDVRKRMLNSEKVKACKNCYYQESVGRLSDRQAFNLFWLKSEHGPEVIKRITQSQKNDYEVNAPPLFLDIRPGNLCNLQCRMCTPSNSSKIYQEQKELHEENKAALEHLIDYEVLFDDEKSFHSWHESPSLWKTIYNWSPTIKKLYFTGGEPTLIKRNWDYIKYMQDKGYSKDIHLVFSINCTYIPDKLLKTFDYFKIVELNLSIDGVGEVQEYIRYPSRWSIIEKNILKILKRRTQNVCISFTPVVQVYNILHITKLFQYMDDLEKDCKVIGRSLIMCTGPRFLDIAICPQAVREVALKNLEDYQSNYLGNDTFFMDGIQVIKTILETVRPKDAPLLLKKFFQYTSLLDNKRGNNFEKTFPQLFKLLGTR